MPRPFPDAFPWQPCARWPTPEAFWEEPIAVDDLVVLADKYSSLLILIGAAGDKTRDRGLRELAGRWPGVLREGQLAPIAVLEARRSAVAAALQHGPAPRASWRASGQAGVPLWAEVHRLLGDLARIRAARVGPGDLPAMLDAEAQRRWPASPAWWSALAWPVDARLTRSWLAAVAGHDPVELDRLLRA